MPSPTDKFLLTRSGHRFRFSAPPGARTYQLEDIAAALSKLCRFGGHAWVSYSVAQHALLVADIVARSRPDDIGLHLLALLHDAHKAYTGEVVSPLKAALSAEARAALDALRTQIQGEIEALFAASVLRRPDLTTLRQTIAIADKVALVTEARDILAPQAVRAFADLRLTPWPQQIRPLGPADAEIRWGGEARRLLEMIRYRQSA